MKNHGFTLVELVVTIAILGILVAIAYPNYTKYITKARRADGKVALMEVQQAQAKLRANCRFYAQDLVNENGDTTDDTTCGATAADTQIEIATASEEGYYALSIDGTTPATASYYKAIADGSGSIQAGDTGCVTLSITVNATNPRGLKEPAACW